jgi:uncharacterized protein
MTKPTLAIVGTGIAGLGAAHHLYQQFDVTLFEEQATVGGHSNTITVAEALPDYAGTRPVPIDTGFMVFNHHTYPLLTQLFEDLGVPTQPTDMSFSLQYQVDNPKRPLEWAGAKLSQVFGQKRNILSPRFWRFLGDLNRFNTEGRALMERLGPDGVTAHPQLAEATMAEWLVERGFGKDLLTWYVAPMGSAIWSTPPGQMLHFPARTLLWFFYNHGFLGRTTQHQWYTVTGGSKVYVEKLIKPFKHRIRTYNPVTQVRRTDDAQAKRRVAVTLSNGATHQFDHVLLACHADQALRLLANPDMLEQQLLGEFSYQANRATLHTDSRVLPKAKGCWASWNYQIDPMGMASTHYWMNQLQGVSQQQQYFVSINNPKLPPPVPEAYILKELAYDHPVFTVASIKAQAQLPQLNARHSGVYFCGSYFRYGFHEDALLSGVQVANLLLGLHG